MPETLAGAALEFLPATRLAHFRLNGNTFCSAQEFCVILQLRINYQERESNNSASAANEVNNFDAVIFFESRLCPCRAAHDLMIEFDGETLRHK